MNLSKNKLATVALVGAGVLALGGVAGTTVLAATTDGEYPTIIQNLATKFGLDPEAVQDVFQETRQQKFTEKLDELVADGEITEEQKSMITAKHAQLMADIDAVREQGLDEEAEREAIRDLHEAYRDWAEENDIDLPMKGMRDGRGLRGEFGREEE